MSKVTIHMNTKDWQYVTKHLWDWYGFKPSVKMLKRVLKNERHLVLEIADQGYLKHGIDTVIRERIVDAFAHELVGSPWPLGCTGKKKTHEFFKEFQQAANRIGMKCNFFDVDFDE